MIGKILNDRYEILSNLGVGGMAYVYLAKDLLLKRKVAVKVLKSEFSDDEEFLNKFQMEAQLAASIAHPNIVNVYDVGREEIDGTIKNFIIMEYVEGSTLSDVIRSEAPFSEERIVKYSKEIASALRKAHEGGLIHRDIKPSNILLTTNDEIKVTDFGIARLVSSATVTYTTSILGTVHYISPEQAKGQKVGKKSDLYSLGVVMYEMATGVVPFDADNSVGIALKHIQEEPVDIKNINPDLNRGLVNIIDNLLEKEPDDRVESANFLLYALDNYKNFNSVPKARSNVDDTILIGKKDQVERTNKYVSPNSNSSQGNYKDKPDRKKWILVGIAIFLLLTLGIYFIMEYIDQNRLEEQMTLVPNLINLTEEQAFDLAYENELELNVTSREYSEEYNKGTVIDQSIEKGEKIKKGSEIGIVVSEGKEHVLIPDLQGYDLDQAREKLSQLGLQYNGSSTETSDEVDKDMVIRSIPNMGESVEKGSLVTLVISLGEEIKEVYVPNLENRTLDEAIQIIQREGLSVGDIERKYDDNILENRVISHSPESGEKVKEDSPIDLVISRGKEASEEGPNENTKPNDEPPSEEKPNNQFNLNIPIPNDLEGETFNIKIYSVNDNNALVFEKEYKTEKLAGGLVKVRVTAKKDTQLDVHLNDESIDFTTE